MATLLRSLKYVKALNRTGSAIRLGRAIVQHENIIKIISINSHRNYVTEAAAATPSIRSEQPTVDALLRQADNKIKRFGGLLKNDLEEIIQSITETGTMTTTQALLIIRCCGEFLEGESLKNRRSILKNVWEIVKDFNVPLDVSHYNAWLLVNLENEEQFSPADFLVELKSKNIEPNRVTFQRLIEYFCTKGDIAGATKILEHMSQHNVPINENIFNSLIKGHTHAGDIPNALNVLNIMNQAGIEPTSRTFSAILCAQAKAGDIDSIRKTLKECKIKDILFTDKEILDVVYSLAMNGFPEYIDEIMTLLVKSAAYNKDVKACVIKLVENNQVDIGYKLLKTMVSTGEDPALNRNGVFFLKKLISNDLGIDTVIKYCNLMKEEKYNDRTFDRALLHCYKVNMPHYALPILKAMKEKNEPIREHYFFPLFVQFSKSNNLQGIINTMKSMIFDFEISPQITSVRDYIIPFMVEEPMANVNILVDNNLSFATAANAMINYLLQNSKTIQAARFMSHTNFRYKPRLLKRSLIAAAQNSKDIDSIVKIMHYQYIKMLSNEEEALDESSEESLTARNFVGSIILTCIKTWPQHENKLVDDFITQCSAKGLGIESNLCQNIKDAIGFRLKPEISSMLDQMASENLKPLPFEKPMRFMSNENQTQKLENLAEKAESSLEFKLVLCQEYAKMRNVEAVEKLLQEIAQENPTYPVGFCASMIDYYSKIDNVATATEWLNRLKEINPAIKLDRSKLLNYAEALIQAKQPEDALKALDIEVNDPTSDRGLKAERVLSNTVKFCPEYVKKIFEKLCENGFIKEPSIVHLQSIIKAKLELNDIEGAMEEFQWACEKFKMTPLKSVLMMKLIDKEDANRLQIITDLCTQLYGEINSLFDLASAFFECNRFRQARRILETPGLRLRNDKVLNLANRFANRNEADKLEDLIQLLSGLFFNMDAIYCKLLECYSKTNNWQKGLALWTQMQEDNLQPSPQFLSMLDRVLRDNRQPIPFTINQGESAYSDKAQEFTSALIELDFNQAESILQTMPAEEKTRYTLHLIEALAGEDNLSKAVEYLHTILSETDEVNSSFFTTITHVVTKLAQADDFSNIAKTVQLFNAAYRKKQTNQGFSFSHAINSVYYDADKYETFVDHLESIIDNPDENKGFLASLVHINTAVKVLIEKPHLEEKYKNFAYKALAARVHGPINALWCHKFITNDPEAEIIWNEVLCHTKRFASVSAVYSIKDLNAWDKLPILAEKITQSEALSFNDKRLTYAQMLKLLLESDASNKYELAYNCVKQAVKVIPYQKLNQTVLQTIEENLPEGFSIKSLREGQPRVQDKAG